MNTQQEEQQLLTEAKNALRQVINNPTSSPAAIAKASSEMRHVLERLTTLDKETPKTPEQDPIEAIKQQIQQPTPPTKKTTPKTP
jgi:hypothetical protein